MKNLILLITIVLSTFQSFAQWTEIIWDTITFEEPYEYLEIDTSSQNIWQVGEPNKNFFDTAYSITNAIITDTINTYPINNYSFFDLYLGIYNIDLFPYDIFIEIKHKFDTDTLKDGGFITVSYDNGLTWLNIIKDTTIMNFQITPYYPYDGSGNLYSENDTLYNGEYGFSGNSNGWISTWFAWYIIPCKNNMNFEGDTLIVRFNFVTDSIETNNEGWMIDNIKLYSADLGGEVKNIKPLDFKIIPNPMNETTTILLGNYEEIELSILNIQGEIISKKKYFSNQSIVINKNGLSSGIYFIKIKKDDGIMKVKKLIIN